MRYSLLLTSLVFASSSYAQFLDVESTVTKVEVYQGRAKVTRSFEVSIAPGATETIRFKSLPNSAHSDSIQLAVTEGPELYFGPLARYSVLEQADESQRLQDLRAAVIELEHQQRRLAHRLKLATNYSAHAENLLDAIRGGIRETGSTELYDLSKTAWTELEQAESDALERQIELQESLRKVEAELVDARRLFNERLNQERQAAVKLTAEATGTAAGVSRGEISYVVTGAGWNPKYMLKAEPQAKQLEVVYQGQVWQNTGEDWDGVRMTLHTGSPALGGAPTEPDPVFLSKWEPTQKTSVNQEMRGTSFAGSLQYSAGQYSAGVPENLPPPPPVTEVSASYTGFEAALPQPITIKAGKPAVIIPILTESTKGDFWTDAIPVTSETTFLSTKFKNPFKLPLLPGSIQVAVDGRLTGNSIMEHTLPEQDVEVGLGQNQNVKIVRTTLAEDRGSKGFIGKSRIEARRYETKVTNNMKVSQRIVIKDRVPISRDDKIKVEVKSPKNANVDPETGLFVWEVTLKPGQSETLLTHYVVTYPEDWQVEGAF